MEKCYDSKDFKNADILLFLNYFFGTISYLSDTDTFISAKID